MKMKSLRWEPWSLWLNFPVFMVSQPFQHHNYVNTLCFIEDLLWRTLLGCKWLPPIDSLPFTEMKMSLQHPQMTARALEHKTLDLSKQKLKTVLESTDEGLTLPVWKLSNYLLKLPSYLYSRIQNLEQCNTCPACQKDNSLFANGFK